MANTVTIPVVIDPAINAEKLNQILSALKKALGPDLGKDVSLIDPAQFKQGFDKASEEVRRFRKETEEAANSGQTLSKAFQFNQIHQMIATVAQDMASLAAPAIQFEQSLADLQSITGVSGDGLATLGDSAINLALTFGGPLSGQIEAMKGTLSRIGPQLAQSAGDFATVTENINILSAASGDDLPKSMDAVTTVLLQWNTNVNDSAEVARESSRAINVLAASAKVGAAEIPQVSEAMKVTGVAASGAKVQIEESAAAIQVLAAGGKVGAEAGTALRNVLGLLQKQSEVGEKSLAKMGLSSAKLGEVLTTKGLDAALAMLNEGMGGLGTVAEKNATLMQLFGQENAAAAGILLKGAEATETGKSRLADWTEQMTGTNVAQEQAAIRMQTTQAAGERFSAWMEVAAIKGFSALGGGFNTLLVGATKAAPALQSFSSLQQIVPAGLVTNLANFGKQILSSVVPGLFAQVTATGGATTATGALNAAMLLNPALLVVAGIAALTAAFLIFGDSTKDLDDATKDAAKAVDDFNTAAAGSDAVDKQSKHLSDLSESYAKLKDASDPESQRKFAEATTELAQAVPDAAEAVDVLDANGQKIATTYKINTDVVAAFSKEQKEMADQIKSDALGNLQDQGRGLADSYNEAIIKQKALRESSNSLNAAIKENGSHTLGNIPGGTETKDLLKDVNKELREQRTNIAAAEPEIRRVIEKYRDMGLSAKEISEQTGLATEDVVKFGGATEGAAVSSKALEESISNLPDSQQKSLRLISDQSNQYKAAQAEVDKLNEKIANQKAVGGDTKDLEKSLADAERLAKEKKIKLTATIETESKGGKDIFAGVEGKAREQLSGVVTLVQGFMGDAKAVATQEDLGAALGQSMKIKGNLDEANAIGGLVDKLKGAKTEAEKADISAAIAAQVPSAISGYDKVTGAVIISTQKVEEYVDAQRKQGDSDIQANQQRFQDGLKSQADVLSQNRDRMAELQQKIVEGTAAGRDVSQLRGQYETLKKTVTGNTEELTKTIAQGQKVGLIKGDVHKLGDEFTLSAKQAQSVAVAVNELDKSVQNVVATAGDLAKSFDDSAKAAKGAVNTDISALTELRQQRRKLAADDNLSAEEKKRRLAELGKQQADIFAAAKKAHAEDVQNEKDKKAVTESVIPVVVKHQAATQKHEKSLYDSLLARYELERKRLDLVDKQSTINAEQLRLQQGRDKNVLDEVAAEDRHTKTLEAQLIKLKEIFKITTGAKGEVLIGAKVKAEDRQKVVDQYNDLVVSVQEQNLKQLEVQLKVAADAAKIQDEIAKLNKDRLTFEISLGLKPQSDLTGVLQSEFDALTAQRDAMQTELDRTPVTGADPKTRADQEAKLRAINAKVLEAEKSLSSQKKTVYDAEVKSLEDSQRQQADIRTKAFEAEKKLQDLLLSGQTQLMKDKVKRDADSDLATLEERRKRSLVGDAEYNAQKESISKQAAKRQLAIDLLAGGQRLRAEEQQSRELLILQARQLDDRIALAQRHGDVEGAEKLTKELDAMQAVIRDKGDLLQSGLAILGDGLSDGINALFSGDPDAAKEGMRKTLGNLFGYLQRLLTAAVAEIVLSSASIKGLAAAAGPAAPIVLAGITALVSGGMNALMQPLLAPLLSFGSGGIVTGPTHAVVGDRNPFRGDDQTEFILGSDQLLRVQQAAIAPVMVPLISGLDDIKQLLANRRVVGIVRGQDLLLIEEAASAAETRRERD